MTKAEKLLQKIRNNPKQVSFEDLEKLLLSFGYVKRQPRKGSSHFSYRHDSLAPLTIPFHRPHVKATYVRDALKAIGEYKEQPT